MTKKARLEQQKNQLDADIVELFCVGGIPPSKVDLPQWKVMWHHAVPSEAAFVRTQQSNQVFVGSEDAHLDGPELLDLLSDKAIELEPQNRSQTPGPSSEVADDGPVAWKFSFSQTL